MHHPLGIDIGGSGIKAAPVNLDTGELVRERIRIDTPQPATPEAIADVVAHLCEVFTEDAEGSPVGITVPAVIRHGVAQTAANIDPTWVGTNVDDLFSERLGRPVHVVNDADAAGLAEVKYGAARDTDGLVIMTTLGTGIGTALIMDGVLVPNSELGHIELDGPDVEKRTSAKVRRREGLSFPEWAERLQRYYSHLEDLLWPERFVVGGGVSKHADEFLPLLDLRTPIVPAQLRNGGGIVGAAHLASQMG